MNTCGVCRQWRAFSMVEVVVALALLSFGVYGAAELVMSARKTGAMSDARMQASALGHLKLEELRCALYGGQITGLTGSEISIPQSGAEAFEQDPRYVWSARIGGGNDQAAPSSIQHIEVRIARASTGAEVMTVRGVAVSGGAAGLPAPSGEGAMQ